MTATVPLQTKASPPIRMSHRRSSFGKFINIHMMYAKIPAKGRMRGSHGNWLRSKKLAIMAVTKTTAPSCWRSHER